MPKPAVTEENVDKVAVLKKRVIDAYKEHQEKGEEYNITVTLFNQLYKEVSDKEKSLEMLKEEYQKKTDALDASNNIKLETLKTKCEIKRLHHIYEIDALKHTLDLKKMLLQKEDGRK
ncbi:uncharacterized protein ASCRUDRAFT_76647 [Ascoidea rubescens DSM 1968]|uniref:Uncharacterized protein n=1 Tax=Ascoidea rubescens DSM 1968 TaxID=1344418 RepID=A0A1D2VEL2_9ASCO|nr:hypothetical protein ASCRUDRAFT_76647 [Ascoidea rubescens DSM 1968]ODV60138.1 hypothetical protein ASCRUDRAFT_76647 [Ascoidea rubescens DSM 1968]